MRIPSSGGPTNNPTSIPTLEPDRRLAAGGLTKTNARVNVQTPGAAFGVGVGNTGNIFDSLVAAGKDVYGILDRENSRARQRDLNTFNARFKADATEWSRMRMEGNSKLSGLGLKGMSANDEKSFRDTFLSPEVLDSIPDDQMDHYSILAKQFINDHLKLAIGVEDTGLDAYEMDSFGEAINATVAQLRTLPHDEEVLFNAKNDIHEIYVKIWEKENEGSTLTPDSLREIQRQTDVAIGTALTGQVEDARARGELDSALALLEDNDRRFFGEDYDELKTALTTERVAAFGLRMGEQHSTIAELQLDNEYRMAT